jgi:DNA (cytosine-5)-methyltransferase 1
MIKALNLYAGIGGNRKKWEGVQVTAVENNAEIAAVYKDLYPQDTVIVGDAHQYLIDHSAEFDFIWTSPPCQSHSSMRQNLAVRFRGTPAEYPDMKLYQEIIYLKYNFAGKWVVENVDPYYEPLIRPSVELQRHLFWTNFPIPRAEFDGSLLREAQIPDLQEYLGMDLSKYKLSNKRQVLRNCVLPALGLHIFNAAQEITPQAVELPLFSQALP